MGCFTAQKGREGMRVEMKGKKEGRERNVKVSK